MTFIFNRCTYINYILILYWLITMHLYHLQVSASCKHEYFRLLGTGEMWIFRSYVIVKSISNCYGPSTARNQNYNIYEYSGVKWYLWELGSKYAQTSNCNKLIDNLLDIENINISWTLKPQGAKFNFCATSVNLAAQHLVTGQINI